MAPTMKDLGIDRLSIEERLVLVQEIWDSIAAEGAPLALSDAQKGVLDRRIAELNANPQNVLTWEEIKAHLRGQISLPLLFITAAGGCGSRFWRSSFVGVRRSPPLSFLWSAAVAAAFFLFFFWSAAVAAALACGLSLSWDKQSKKERKRRRPPHSKERKKAAATAAL